MQILCNCDFFQSSVHSIQAQIAQSVYRSGYIPDDPLVRIQAEVRHFSFGQNAQI